MKSAGIEGPLRRIERTCFSPGTAAQEALCRTPEPPRSAVLFDHGTGVDAARRLEAAVHADAGHLWRKGALVEPDGAREEMDAELTVGWSAPIGRQHDQEEAEAPH